MGSTGSRPQLRKVAPCDSVHEEGTQPKPQWTVPALPVTVERAPGSLGQKKTTLPPLKQEITLSTLSGPCFSGSLPPKQSNNSSIILSHPPRRPQALQPLARQIGHTSTANQIAMGRDCRGGGVHPFSSTGQTGLSGTGRMIQGGFLEAQTALGQQAHRHRRAHLRQAREQRRHKIVYTRNIVGPNPDLIQEAKLVRRPTERDIFWDETTGGSLDVSCLLDPKSPPGFCERQCNQTNKQLPFRGGERVQRVQAQGRTQRPEPSGLSLDKNSSWAAESEIMKVEDSRTTHRSGWMVPESTGREGKRCKQDLGL